MFRTLLNEIRNEITLFREDGSNVEFRITKCIGRGSSCLVYHTIQENTEHLLKEYYPRNLDIERDCEGNLVIPEDQKDEFVSSRERFHIGGERQKELRLEEKLKNYTSNVQGSYFGNGTEYIDMTCFAGCTYDNVEENSLCVLMRRMKTLAQVIGYYHNAGLLHLDIKPQNIYVRPKEETVEDIMLFDFDSIVSKHEVMSTSVLSYTKDWAAPEQLLSYRHKEICEATDIFAIGEIIFTKIFGRHTKDFERRSFVKKYSYDYGSDIFKNINPKIFPHLDDLLSHTICGVVEKRYQSTEQLIEKLDEIITILSLTEPYLISNVSSLDVSVSKNMKTLTKIHETLQSENRYFIRSTPKRNISRYAKDYIRYFGDRYEVVMLLDCRKGLVDMFEDVPLINFEKVQSDSSFDEILRIFNVLENICDQNVLIILDHFDERYLVDSNHFDMNEVSEICSRLMLLNATILVNGSFDVSNFYKKEHFRHYHELLYKLAEICCHKYRYVKAKYYIKKAISVADGCAKQYVQKFKEEDINLLNFIWINDWWSFDINDPDENETDSFLEQFLDCVDDVD